MVSSTKSENTDKKVQYQLYMRIMKVIKPSKDSFYQKPKRTRVYCSKIIDPAFFQSEAFDMAQRLFQKMGKVEK